MSKLSRKKFKRGDSTQQPSQQHGCGDTHGPFTHNTTVSDTHRPFTQQSTVSDTLGHFNHQSSSQQARGTTNFNGQTPYQALRLKNVGNSCFSNSALQLLYSIKEFREFILSRRYTNLSGEIIHKQLIEFKVKSKEYFLFPLENVKISIYFFRRTRLVAV